MTATCNGCGDCCDPLRIPMGQYGYILQWADMPNPFTDFDGFLAAAEERELKLPDKLDSKALTQAEQHIQNGTFAKAHWNYRDRQSFSMTTDEVVIQCPFFDRGTRMCTAHDDRPPVCSGFPWYGLKPGTMPSRPSDRCSYWEDVTWLKRPAAWRKRTWDEMHKELDKKQEK